MFLNRALATVPDDQVRLGLMNALSAAPDEEYVGVLQSLAAHDHGPVGLQASTILRSGFLTGHEEIT